MNRTRATLLITAIVTVALHACGSSSTTTNTSSSSARPNTFVLTEWSVTPPAAHLQAGKLQITAANNGNETHELVIVRASDAASLPTKPDGSVDEDGIAEGDKAGEVADVAAGKSVTKTLDLAAGHYVAMCNLVEQMGHDTAGMANGAMGGGSGMSHVHYGLGMVTQFTVG